MEMRLFKRLIFVLASMISTGWVSQAQAVEACQVTVKASPKELILSQLPVKTQKALMGYVFQLLRVDIPEALIDKTITANEIKDLSELPTTPAETKILHFFAAKANAGQLPQTVTQMLDQVLQLIQDKPEYSARLGGMTPEKRAFAEQMLLMAMQSTLSERGLLNSVKTQYVEWVEINKNVSEAVKNVEHLDFDGKLKALTGESYFKADSIQLLADGKKALENRINWIREAQKEVSLFYWALYDDKTGTMIADELLKAASRGVTVRLLVDGQTSMRPGYGSQVKRLEESKQVEVIRWFHAELPHLGQHIKSMVVDGKVAQLGGMNGGDVYSHINPETAHWSDTDIAVRGGSVIARVQKEMADIWNQQVESRKLALKPMESFAPVVSTKPGVDMMIVRHDPAKDKKGSKILKTIIAAIDSAQKSIEIENAYIIAIPALKEATDRAVKRNVKVRFLTNSNESVDEPIIALPIVRSAQDLSAAKAEVYLKKGATLHSKIAVVDSQHSLVMSYNIHPRSEKLENELLVVIRDQDMGQQMSDKFAEDAKSGVRLESPKDITLPFDPSVFLTLRIFFDQL